MFTRAASVAAAVLLLAAGAGERSALRADPPARSARVVAYTIEAALDPAAKEVRGTADLVWRNASAAPVEELWFHLYLNAFRAGSTYLREAGYAGKAGARWDADHAGAIEIHRLAREDGTDLWTDATRTFEAPDDGNEKDRTLARVALPAPVAPGETTTLRIEFTSTLPRVMHRTGWAGDPDDPDSLFFMVAQWFPKIAVLRAGEDGTFRWNAHQFHKNTEFFSDYGVYRVSLTVPEGYEVGATGKRVSGPVAADGGRATFVYEQADVHDFAWTASPHFLVQEFRWTFDDFCANAPDGMGARVRALLARTAAHRGVTVDEAVPQQAVDVRLLLQPDHDEVGARFRWAVGAALACYGVWFGAYPYDVLTVVDPPAGGRAAGGMEYPTLFTVWGDRLAPPAATGMESVTIHEFGHQFFYGLVGTNEFEEAWLDEGLTSYTDDRVHEIAYGPATRTVRYGPVTLARARPFAPPRVFPRLKRLLFVDRWAGRLPRPWSEPGTWLPVPRANPAWTALRDLPFLHFDAGVPVPQPLSSRHRVLDARSDDAMVRPGWTFASRRDYGVNAYAKPTVFFYCLRGLMGEEAFDRALHAYATRHRFGHPRTDDLRAILREHAPEDRQAWFDGFTDAMLESAARLDVAVLEASERKVGDEWEWTVRVQRRGGVPVPIEVHAEDERGDHHLLATWFSRGRETTRTFRARFPRRLRAVRLGPDWLAHVDADVSNNAHALHGADRRPAVLWSVRWSLYAEEVLRTYAGLNR